MTIKEAKEKFLKKVISQSEVDAVEVAKQILPYKLQWYGTYTLLTRININKSDKFLSRDDVLSFYKDVYDTWFDFVTSLDENNYNGKTKDAIIKIKTDARFNKKNMKPLDCEKFILETYDKEFSKSGLRPSTIQNDSVIDENRPDFVHVHPFIYPGNIDCRLYLNLKTENTIKLGRILMDKCYKKHYRLYFKFWTAANDRNDTFLIYTNYGRVQKMINMLNEIKAEHPEIFEGAETSNIMLPLIDGYIGFGEEPAYKHSSFNLERGNAYDKFFSDLIKNQMKAIGNYNGLIRNSLGQELNLKDYLIYLLEKSFKETIKNRQIEILKGQYPDKYKTAQQIKDYIDIQKNIYEKCKEKTPDFLKQQIEENAEKIINGLKSGGCPYVCSLIFKTQKVSLSMFAEDWAKEILKKNGSIDYSLTLDLNPREKLFDVFDVENNIAKQITAENLQPYFDEHHVSMEYPFLNTETVKELEQILRKDDDTDSF